MMSQNTMELRRVCETYAGIDEPEGYSQIDNVISSSVDKIFDFDYPIFDESYRKVIETKIIKTYYLREICDVPIGKWKLFLAIKMNNLMPYYNQLYESQKLSFNPLFTVDYTREYDRNVDNTETGDTKVKGTLTVDVSTMLDANNTTTENEKLRHSDTPQGKLQMLEDGTYMSSGDVNERTTTDNGKTTGSNNSETQNTSSTTKNDKATTTEGYVEKIQGKNDGKSYGELIIQFRESLINIDLMLIEELETLFWPLYE